MLKYQVFEISNWNIKYQTFGHTNHSDKKMGKTGNLPSDGGYFIYNSHFDKSCFERNLEIIILTLLRLFKFC